MTAPRLLSLQVGRLREFEGVGTGRKWQSAIIKEPVSGPIDLKSEGLVGDVQVDRVNHGGFEKAVLAYSADHFSFWAQEFSSEESHPSIAGAFGENLTVVGLTEEDVCIGDVWKIGECKLQVSQPRQPCWKLSKRWKIADLSVRVQRTGFTGWYFRILEVGQLSPETEIEVLERPNPQWTIQTANEVMYEMRSAEKDRELAACPEISEAWRTQLLDRAAKRERNGS